MFLRFENEIVVAESPIFFGVQFIKWKVKLFTENSVLNNYDYTDLCSLSQYIKRT